MDIDMNEIDNKKFEYWEKSFNFYYELIQNQKELKFAIETKMFVNQDFDNWEGLFPYHCVYILENGKQVYIGETNDIVRRSTEHDSNALKNKLKQYKFKRIHIISGLLAEVSPAKLYECLLLELFKADLKFIVVNDNNGQKTNFIRKNTFELLFDELWSLLEQKGLVKAKEFKNILNSGAYKYSPDVPLTDNQKTALTCIVNTIVSEGMQPTSDGSYSRPIIINGDAGTGKTVVATALLHYLKTHDKFKGLNIALVYASPAIRDEIKNAFKNMENLASADVISPIE